MPVFNTQLWTVPEVAARLQVDDETVRRYIRAGKLRATLFGANSAGYRISEESLQAFIQAGEERAAERNRQL